MGMKPRSSSRDTTDTPGIRVFRPAVILKGRRARRAPGTGESEPRPPHGLDGSIPLGHRDPPAHLPGPVLQFPEDVYGSFPSPETFACRLLFDEFRKQHASLPRGQEWFVWVGDRVSSAAGYPFWLAFSAEVPDALIDRVARTFGAFALEWRRAKIIPREHDLQPLLYLGDEGMELLRMI